VVVGVGGLVVEVTLDVGVVEGPVLIGVGPGTVVVG